MLLSPILHYLVNTEHSMDVEIELRGLVGKDAETIPLIPSSPAPHTFGLIPRRSLKYLVIALIIVAVTGFGIGAIITAKSANTLKSTSVLMSGPAGEDTLNFAMIGDFGRSGLDGQSQVAQQMARFCGRFDCKFILSVGDNFYPSGVVNAKDPNFDLSWKNIYNQPEIGHLPWYMSLGNHDYRGVPEAELEYAQMEPRYILPARYYSVRVGRNGPTEDPNEFAVEFFILDTSPFVTQYITDPAYQKSDLNTQNHTVQLEWLKEKLAIPPRNPKDWRVVVGHHPVYSYVGSHATPLVELITQLKPVLLEHNVQLYLAGHDHCMQALHVPGEEIQYVVNGAGSLIDGALAADHQYLDWYVMMSGFSMIRVSESEIFVDYVTLQGEVVHSVNVKHNLYKK